MDSPHTETVWSSSEAEQAEFALAQLQRAGFTCRLVEDPFSAKEHYGLAVPADQAEDAKVFVASLFPDKPEQEESEDVAEDPERARCPFCSQALPEYGDRCGECGASIVRIDTSQLPQQAREAFPDAKAACESCGLPSLDPAQTCESCAGNLRPLTPEDLVCPEGKHVLARDPKDPSLLSCPACKTVLLIGKLYEVTVTADAGILAPVFNLYPDATAYCADCRLPSTTTLGPCADCGGRLKPLDPEKDVLCRKNVHVVEWNEEADGFVCEPCRTLVRIEPDAG